MHCTSIADLVRVATDRNPSWEQFYALRDIQEALLQAMLHYGVSYEDITAETFGDIEQFAESRMARLTAEAALARVVATASWRIDPAVRHADLIDAVCRAVDAHDGDALRAAHDAQLTLDSIRPYRSREISAQLAVLREMARHS